MAGPAGAAASPDRLKVAEIFFSIQGEARFSGCPTAFVRLTGCPLRCEYCDTSYAFTGGEWWELEALLAEVARYRAQYVCVTGGEPLAQPRCHALLSALCDAGYQVSLETSGALDVGTVDERVSRVMDIKTPGSGEVEHNRWENLALLGERDTVKLVICDRKDYEWACSMLDERIQVPCPVFFSSGYDSLPPETLAEWMLEDRVPARFQVQLHKVLWGDTRGR